MSTYEHSLMLRNQEKEKNTKKAEESIKRNSTMKSIELPRSPRLPPVKSQPIMSIDERLTVKTANPELNKGYLSNENNYLEVSYKKQNKLNSLNRQSDLDSNDNIESMSSAFPVDKSNLTSNSVSRIPCINSDAKNKYAKFENNNQESDIFSSESASSTFSQRQVPLFLPITSNLSDNEEKEEDYEVYVKRSTRRSRLVKVPLKYYDTSPEPSSK